MNKTLKTILLSALGLAVLIGGASLISSAVSNNDEEGLVEINPKFSIGGLQDTTGKYVESDLTLYTEEAFECYGLQIKPNFDSKVQYQIFFYDEIGNFVSSTELLDGSYRDEVPYFATHARLELTPIWAEDVKESERVLKWSNKRKYTDELEIKVFEEQERSDLNIATEDLFEYQGLGNFSAGEFTADETSTNMVSKLIDVTAYDRLLITIPRTMYDGKTCQIYGREGTNGNINMNYKYWDNVDKKFNSNSVTFVFEIGDSKSLVIIEDINTTSVNDFKAIEVYGLE